MNTEKIAVKVSIITIIGNVLLSVCKIITGIVAHSSAMISDAIHSASDVFSTLIVIIGIKISNRESDKNHLYGHERLECVAAIILSVILAITGFGIGYSGVKVIFSGNYDDLRIPGFSALVIAIFSIILKELMYWYTRAAAKKINSGALMADAWHHRSDSLSSIGSFLGILGARLGFPILDSVASVIICLFILKVAFNIFSDSIGKMTDKAWDDNNVNAMKNMILSQEGVLKIDQIKTRLFGNKVYVDIEIQVNGDETVSEAHEIAQNVHDEIEKHFDTVKHCMVHVNPAGDINQ